jgi:HTTM domain
VVGVLRDLRRYFGTKHRLIAVALLRISLGLLTLVFYTQHWSQHAFLWGNDGVLPYGAFRAMMEAESNLSLYMIGSAPEFGRVVFWLGVVVTVAFTIGFFTRISSVLFYLFIWSLYTRNPFVMDGGDNLLYILAFYLMFTDSGAYFSLDAALGRGNRERDRPIAALVHNFATLAILIQICLLYFTSAFFKSQGHMWQNGTALYYILRTAEFNLSPLEHIFYYSDEVVTLLTWSTVVFQMAWPFLIWFRRPRPFLYLGSVMLHSMIGYFMGLVWFSAVMISAEIIVFEDDEYRRYGGRLAGLGRRLRRFAEGLGRGSGHRSPVRLPPPREG